MNKNWPALSPSSLNGTLKVFIKCLPFQSTFILSGSQFSEKLVRNFRRFSAMFLWTSSYGILSYYLNTLCAIFDTFSGMIFSNASGKSPHLTQSFAKVSTCESMMSSSWVRGFPGRLNLLNSIRILGKRGLTPKLPSSIIDKSQATLITLSAPTA